jgi:hypothetical protein
MFVGGRKGREKKKKRRGRTGGVTAGRGEEGHAKELPLLETSHAEELPQANGDRSCSATTPT